MLKINTAIWLTCVVLSAVRLGAAAPAVAQGKSKFSGKFTANVALTSEYDFR